MSKLAGLGIRDAEYVKDAESGKDVFHVTDPHALIQAAGYLIYTHSQTDKENIYYRGQGRLYDGIVPTLFRGVHNKVTQANRQGSLTKYIEEIRKHNKIFGSFSEVVHEPLLQHYGINTSWIDLVENIWVALWFACHKARYTGQYGHYLHFERRSSSKAVKDAFVYILLVGTEFSRMKTDVPGLFVGKNTELVDLRMAAPSIFLRPHAQHGVLFRARGDHFSRPLDYGSAIRGVIRADLSDALNWLGDGKLLSVHSLFPPPVYDQGYEYLLSCGVSGNAVVGEISHVGA